MNDSSEKWVGQVTNLSYRFSLFQGVARDMNDSSEKWVGQVTNLSYRFSLFQGVFNDDMNDFLLFFFATTQEGAKKITEQTEKTERTEPSQETFRPFRFFRLFRNRLRHFQSRYEFYFHERSEDNTARRI